MDLAHVHELLRQVAAVRLKQGCALSGLSAVQLWKGASRPHFPLRAQQLLPHHAPSTLQAWTPGKHCWPLHDSAPGLLQWPCPLQHSLSLSRPWNSGRRIPGRKQLGGHGQGEAERRLRQLPPPRRSERHWVRVCQLQQRLQLLQAP